MRRLHPAMEEGGSDEGFVREWSPCTRMLGLIPPRVQVGLFSTELCLTCIDAVSDYVALGTNVGLVYWYCRRKGTMERLRCEVAQSSITCVKIVNTVDYMVAAGNTNGQVTVFQVPKELPDSVPVALKPKTEQKVERYTIGELHKGRITAIEWSKNGMRLFSGDKNGVIIMTEIDFYMHLCKSVEIVNEEYEIVQISYYQNSLLVSSVYRTILCEKREGKWEVSQVGKKERKSLCELGAVFHWSLSRGGEACAYCARPGLRLWRADKAGEVQQTLLFKDAISNPITIAELLNPSHSKHSHNGKEYNFGPLHMFREKFIVTHNKEVLYVLDPRSLTAVAVVDDLRRILSVSVSRDEIFVLEGERCIVRLGYAPDTDLHSPGEDPLNLMTKSLTTSIQHAMNTVRELTKLDQANSFIASVIEQPMSSFTESKPDERALECFELPPIKKLPEDVRVNVLESIVESFKDGTEVKSANTEELQRKVKIFNSIADPKYDELIHSSRRNRKGASGSGTPKSTPVKRAGNCANGVNGDAPGVGAVVNLFQPAVDENDEEMLRQLEEKEKILAKMLDLESLSIPPKEFTIPKDSPEPLRKKYVSKNVITTPKTVDTIKAYSTIKTGESVSRIGHGVGNDHIMTKSFPIMFRPKQEFKDTLLQKPLEDVIPKVAKIPQNWNLGSLQVIFDSMKLEGKERLLMDQLPSPDGIEEEWEFV